MRVSELKQEVDSRYDHVGAQFKAVDPWIERIDARFDSIDARFDSLEATIDAAEAGTRRHIDTVIGQLRSDIALMLSGVAAMNERLDRWSALNGLVQAIPPSMLSDDELRLRILERSRQ